MLTDLMNSDLLFLTLFALAVMTGLALIDLYTFYRTQRHIDLKSVITSVGILGTFVGIYLGLADFDHRPGKIDSSITELLGGMRFAFATSIFGIFFSIVLSFIQKSYPSKRIKEKMLSAEFLQATEVLRSLERNSTAVVSVLESPEIPARIERTFERSIEAASEHTKRQVLNAVSEIASRFNATLADQFGENFKRMEQAAFEMLRWLDRYRQDREAWEAQFAASTETIKAAKTVIVSIVDTQERSRDVFQEAQHLIADLRQQALGAHKNLRSYEEITNHLGETMKGISSTLDRTEEHTSRSSEIAERLHGLAAPDFALQLDTIIKKFNTATNSLNTATNSLDNVISGLGGASREATEIKKNISAAFQSLRNDIENKVAGGILAATTKAQDVIRGESLDSATRIEEAKREVSEARNEIKIMTNSMSSSTSSLATQMERLAKELRRATIKKKPWRLSLFK